MLLMKVDRIFVCVKGNTKNKVVTVTASLLAAA